MIWGLAVQENLLQPLLIISYPLRQAKASGPSLTQGQVLINGENQELENLGLSST